MDEKGTDVPSPSFPQRVETDREKRNRTMPPIPKKMKKETPRVEFVHVGEEALAVNLFDLDRIEETVRASMFADKLVLTDTVWVDRNRVDEIAVVFKCSILKAACLLDVVRGRDRRAGDHPTRAYIRRRRVWDKIPADALLTLVEDGQTVLNPAVFKIEAKPLDLPSSLPQRVEGGGRKLLRRRSEEV